MGLDAARRRLGERMVGLFEFASLVSGGELLSTNTRPPWAGLGGAALMPPSPSVRHRGAVAMWARTSAPERCSSMRVRTARGTTT
jgi:hypothetical protein